MQSIVTTAQNFFAGQPCENDPVGVGAIREICGQCKAGKDLQAIAIHLAMCVGDYAFPMHEIHAVVEMYQAREAQAANV